MMCDGVGYYFTIIDKERNKTMFIGAFFCIESLSRLVTRIFVLFFVSCGTHFFPFVSFFIQQDILISSEICLTVLFFSAKVHDTFISTHTHTQCNLNCSLSI